MKRGFNVHFFSESNVMFLRYHLTSINLFFILIILFFLFINKSYAEYSKIWEKVSPSIVSVLPTWPGYDKPGFGAPFGTSPEGSGIVIHDEKGIILTASHVINRALEVSVRDINGTIKQAEIIFDDPKIDIALLKTRKIGKSISISKKSSKIGSKVCILSNSFGLDINITCGKPNRFSEHSSFLNFALDTPRSTKIIIC